MSNNSVQYNNPSSDTSYHLLSVTVDGVWIGNWIYWALNTRNYRLLWESHWVTHSKDHCNCSTHKVFSVFTGCCLVGASSGGRSASFGFLNCPWPQLLVSPFSHMQLSTKLLVLIIWPWHGLPIKRLFHYCALTCCRENCVHRAVR
jgi:hypothetical protein